MVIYEPKGRAREYSPLALNIYSGCGHGCKYCYAPSATYKTREAFERPGARRDIIHRVQRDAEKLAGDKRPVLLCFTCDPYQPFDMEHMNTRQVIRVMNRYNLTVRVLTKGGMRAVRDFDLLGQNRKNEFGATLTFIDPEASRKWEPRAALPQERMDALKTAHDAGIRTWVSLEPVIDTEQTLELIRMTVGFVDVFKVGKLNYLNLGIDWHLFYIRVVCELEKTGKPYYIKKDLKRYASSYDG